MKLSENTFIIFFLIFIYLFIWLHWVLVVARRLSSCGAQALEHVGSVVVVCGLGSPVACGILVPRPRIEPSSPALEGGFLTTAPPGKSHIHDIKWKKSVLQ